MASKRSRAVMALVRLSPGTNAASGLVQGACSVFVAAGIETAEVIGQAEQKS